MLNSLAKAIVFVLLSSNLLYAQTGNDFFAALYQENWEKAIATQEKHCNSTPSDWTGWMHLADAYLAANRTGDAGKALLEAEKNAPKAAYQSIIAGRKALIANDREGAEKQFKSAAKSGKKDATALRLIGESWLFGPNRDLASAKTWLSKAHDKNRKDFQTVMDLGFYYINMIDGGNALIEYDKAQMIAPDNPLPALMSYVVYRNAKLPQKQLEYLDKAINIDPRFATAIRKKGELAYHQLHDYALAEKTYNDLIQSGNATVDDKMMYVNCLFLNKKYDETVMWVDKIISEDGSKNYLRRLSAFSSYETGNYEKGKAIMDEYFAEVSPERIIYQDYEYYARLLQQEKQDSLAAVYFEKAVQLNPSQWQLYGEIGSIRYKIRDYQGAANAYKTRLDSLATPGALDYYQIGIAYFMLRDSAEYVTAANYFAKVRELMPDKTTGWLMEAKTWSKLEPDVETYPERLAEFGKARNAFEHFVAIAETDAVKYKDDLIKAYEYLAYYYILQKDNAQVASYQEKLLAIDPSNEIASGITDWLESEGDN